MPHNPIPGSERANDGAAYAPAFLLHRRAGGGRVAIRLRRLLQRAGTDSAPPAIVPLASYADACSAIARLEPQQLPVAVGGDGTVAMVAAAILSAGAAETPLGIVPLGTANLLARDLGMVPPTQALRALVCGATRRIDVMRTSHPDAPLALVSISTGFEGRFMRAYGTGRGWGRHLAAVTAVVGAGLRTVRIGLELDGRGVLEGNDRAFSVGLYNTRRYAGGLVMSPWADLEDGWCEAAAYRSAASYAAALAAGLRAGRRRPPVNRSAGPEPRQVSRLRWQAARLECDGPLQIDGEAFSGGAFSITVAAQALRVIVPAL